MGRSILISSGKGGVGKTTITATLGRCLARMGNRVVLIDTDIGLNNLDVLMDIEGKICYDIIDVIQNRCRIKQALVQDIVEKNLYVLPSCHSYNIPDISSQNIKLVIKSLLQYDYILVDCPAGIENGFHRVATAVNEAIIVTTPHLSAIRDAYKTIEILKDYGINSNVIVNRVRGDLVESEEMIRVDEVEEFLKTGIIGVIPEDDEINILSSLGVPIKEKSRAGKAFSMIANNIQNNTNNLFDCSNKYKGFLGAIKRGIRKIV